MIEHLAPVAAFFIAAASPGPATLAVAGAAMGSGLRAALWLSGGLATSLAAWGVLVALGFGSLVEASPPAQIILRVGGGLFLLYLAWGSLRSALTAGSPPLAPAAPPPAPAVTPDGATRERLAGLRWALRGVLLNGLNPKAGLAWAAVIALGGTADPSRIWQIVGLCSLIGLAIYGVYAAAFSAKAARRLYRRARRGIDGAVALGFGAAGAALLGARN